MIMLALLTPGKEVDLAHAYYPVFSESGGNKPPGSAPLKFLFCGSNFFPIFFKALIRPGHRWPYLFFVIRQVGHKVNLNIHDKLKSSLYNRLFIYSAFNILFLDPTFPLLPEG